MKRTASFDVDRDFDVYCDVTKYTTLPDGRRLIRGVATGTLEDRDGERVSQRAIAEMLAQGPKGIKVVAGTHQQDWTNEIGDAAEFRLDPETGELIADAILPAEGKDPLADKACNRIANGEKLGWSIGGKLRKAYFELADDPAGGVRKRKVLDSIALRHLCLTEKPSYATSSVGFADAVAKTAKDFVADDSLQFVDVDDDQETQDALAIAKAAKTPPPDDQAAADDAAGPADGQAPPDDSAAAPAAGTADTSQAGAPAATDDAAGAGAAPDPNAPPSDAQAAQGLPLSNRHLSCPNCGEEFAAPLPDDAQGDDDGAADPPSPEDTGKTHTPKENTMDPKAVLAQLDALRATVEKTVAAPEGTVAKTAEPTDVERMLAVVHKTSTERADALEAGVTEGLELVAKTVQELAERINAMPQGRRSSAAPASKPDVEVTKTATDDDDVQKTAEKLAESGDLAGALRTLNAARGIR